MEENSREEERERAGWRSWSKVSTAAANRASWQQSVEALSSEVMLKVPEVTSFCLE